MPTANSLLLHFSQDTESRTTYTCDYNASLKYIGIGISPALVVLFIFTYIRAYNMKISLKLKMIYSNFAFGCIFLAIICNFYRSFSSYNVIFGSYNKTM